MFSSTFSTGFTLGIQVVHPFHIIQSHNLGMALPISSLMAKVTWVSEIQELIFGNLTLKS
jgi:hypothetical protein